MNKTVMEIKSRGDYGNAAILFNGDECSSPVAFFRKVYTIIFIFYLPACALQPQEITSDNYNQAYEKAIKDAATAESNEISKNLVAIVPSNKNLLWKGEDKDRSVLMLTWTSWDGYDQSIGRSVTIEREVWVTAVPELKVFCQKLENKTKLVVRLEQLLGLPVGSGKTKFVEFWVKPSDLFRPSADPEISDHEAEINFPVSRYFIIDDAYQSWFTDLKSQSYGKDGYPWTRLGYTYDWGSSVSEVGLSEFVIAKGATIEVHAISSTMDYCQK
jgi:hypothetical protein